MDVKSLLMERKFFESAEEVERLLEEANVEEGSIIQAMLFDKAQFPEQADAMDFAATHGFSIENAEEAGEQYLITQFDVSEFEDDSLRQIELRTGVSIFVGLIRVQEINAPDFFLSLRNEKGITCSESLPHIIELAKTVQGFHAAYGEVAITEEMLSIMEMNFNDNVVGVDLMIDYDHDQKEAAGWIKEVYLSLDKTTLYGVVKWTPKGALALNDRSFRYFSPEFTLNYVHPHSGVVHGPTLLGGGLVNRPFLKMEAIVGFSNKQEGNNVETINLKDHDAVKAGFEKQVAEFKLSEEKTATVVNGLKDENVKLSEKLKELEADKAQKELEAKNEKLFGEDKINKAQLVALNEGKDIYEVMALSEKMNTTPKGENSEGIVITLSEAELSVCTKLGLTPEEFIKYNGGE